MTKNILVIIKAKSPQHAELILEAITAKLPHTIQQVQDAVECAFVPSDKRAAINYAAALSE